MKFACPKCNSKYTIADERVRDKVLKIRCKSCDTVIKVRDPKSKRSGAAKKDSPKVSSALENKFADSFKQGKKGLPKPKGTPGLYAAVKRSVEVLEKKDTDYVHWFVAIDKAPFGPVSAKKIRSLKKNKKVDDKNLVWKEGMADWIPAGQCKELVGLFAKIDLEAELHEKEEKRESDHVLGLFKEEKKSEESPLKGRSVGLIADRIDEEVKEEEKKEEEPKADEKPGSLDSLQVAAEDSFFERADDSTAIAVSRTQKISHLTPPRPANQGQNRWVMIAAVGFFFVAVATFGVAIFGGGESSGNATTVETVERVIERVVYLDRPVETTNESNPVVEDEVVEDKNGSKSGSRSNRNKSKKKQEADAKTLALMEQLGMSTPGGAVPVGGLSKQSSSGGSSGSGSLTSTQVKKVVDKNKSRLKACYERALKTGEAPEDNSIRVDFKLKVGSSGMVKSTSLGGAGAQIPSLNQCLTRSVSKWVFPASSSTSPVEFPFVFTPK